jgi:hypothetical protein
MRIEGGAMINNQDDVLMRDSVFLWIALGTGLLLLLPLLAMQVTAEVNWTLSDFATMGVLLFGTGTIFVLAARKVNKKYRVAVAIATAAACLYLWAELAVGIFTTWGT